MSNMAVPRYVDVRVLHANPLGADAMSNTEEQRKAFEAWLAEPPHEQDVSRFPEKHGYRWEGNYCHLPVQIAWEAWQKAKSGSEWIPVSERMPPSGALVLVAYRNDRGEWRRIRAQWVAAKSVEASDESEIGEYDEATDTYYDPEGWYERINNWDDYSGVMVHDGTPSHWMPLPPPPEEATP